jgi:hypothetical protein
VAALAASCAALRVLDLSNHDAVTDDGLAALAALSALEELTLVRNSRVTRAGACVRACVRGREKDHFLLLAAAAVAMR